LPISVEGRTLGTDGCYLLGHPSETYIDYEEEMPQEIKTISVPLPYRLGSVNCYLAKTDTGYVLIDTGCTKRRTDLVKELESAGCKPGNLQVIILTHGDFDHSGNAAFLRKIFGARILMHRDDSGMVERGNMYWNRNKSNILIRTMAPVFFRFGKSERFKPDSYVEDGEDLSGNSLDARVLHIPGHSKGSIGILTSGGELFCGDLLENRHKPKLNSLMDDLATANTSVEKLSKLGIRTVYPGHGKPFAMDVFKKAADNPVFEDK
jgi:glyoxylase-like metal-dependent hydrolase (beta-lactamase superfamily II)